MKDRHDDMTPYYNYLIDGNYGLNILVFSGDDDDVCATIGTQDWIWGLGYEVRTDHCCDASHISHEYMFRITLEWSKYIDHNVA